MIIKSNIKGRSKELPETDVLTEKDTLIQTYLKLP